MHVLLRGILNAHEALLLLVNASPYSSFIFSYLQLLRLSPSALGYGGGSAGQANSAAASINVEIRA
jgi:hypothetical protein